MCARSRLSCEVVRLRGDREALDIVIAARDATLARVEVLAGKWDEVAAARARTAKAAADRGKLDESRERAHMGNVFRGRAHELRAALKGDS